MLTQAQIESAFGKFTWRDDPNRRGAIIISGDWQLHNLTRLTPPFPMRTGAGGTVREIVCHAHIAGPLLAVLRDLQSAGLSHLINTYDGCWVPRHMCWDPQRPLSRHSWGIAIDLNARLFPYGSHARQDARLIEAFRRQGFAWGGYWRRPDPMHFEFVGAPDRDGMKVIVNDQLVSREGQIRSAQAVGPLAPIVEAVGGTLAVHPEQNKIYIYTHSGGAERRSP